MTLKEKITEIFNKHNLDYDCDYNNNAQQVIITILDGDWKHDHLYLKNIMEQNGFTIEDEYITSCDSDCYDCKYVFQLN